MASHNNRDWLSSGWVMVSLLLGSHSAIWLHSAARSLELEGHKFAHWCCLDSSM